MRREEVMNVLPCRIRGVMERKRMDMETLQEIRFRVGSPMFCWCHGTEIPVYSEIGNRIMITREDMQEMKKGFITISGGHRAGIAGEVILENGQVKTLRNVSSINLRLSHEVIGCADTVIPYITQRRNIYHTLIVSPPGCGKTTLLRDVIRQISDGSEYRKGVSVGVVDERSEIGCKILATAHAGSMQELRKRPLLERMIECEQFERYIVLSNQKHIGQIEGIYDSRGRILYREGI